MESKQKNSYDENNYYLQKYQEGDAEAEVKLMEINSGLVNGLAHRFKGRGVEFEDLVQIGSIGMLKAIRSFDLSRGTAFSTYAVPLIIGEIRRFLRDDGIIKVSRNQKRLGARLMHQRELYISEHGIEPPLSVLAEMVDVTVEEAAIAMDCTSPVHSLSEPIGDDELLLENVLTSSEDDLGKMVEQIALEETIKTLPPLWKKILLLRYFRDYSQQQTADALGLTQVKISREEKKIFNRLREELA